MEIRKFLKKVGYEEKGQTGNGDFAVFSKKDVPDPERSVLITGCQGTGSVSAKKSSLFSASVRCPECGRAMKMRVSEQKDHAYRCLDCCKDFNADDCPETVDDYSNKKGVCVPLYEITLHGQSADWYAGHKDILDCLCGKYGADFMGCADGDGGREVFIDFGWEKAPDTETVQGFTDAVSGLLPAGNSSGGKMPEAAVCINAKEAGGTEKAVKTALRMWPDMITVDGSLIEDREAGNGKKPYWVTMKVSGRYIAKVFAEDIESAKAEAEYEYSEADFGELSDIEGMPVIVEDGKGDYVWEL